MVTGFRDVRYQANIAKESGSVFSSDRKISRGFPLRSSFEEEFPHLAGSSFFDWFYGKKVLLGKSEKFLFIL